MTGGGSPLPLPREDGGGRYPGFDVMAQSPHWDDATTSVVTSRLGPPPDIRFFTPEQEATATALCDRLLAQDAEPKIPVVPLIDARMCERQTDGWHYEDMPTDDQAWPASLRALNEDAQQHSGCRFHELDQDAQLELLQSIQDRNDDWHGMPSGHVWSLWTRYACTAFYSHPWAWDEIGFAGPAYPRGYKNLGVDALEPFEVADVRPDTHVVREHDNGRANR